MVYRINRELGTTVIISEHRLEELFPMADKVLVMDEGKLIACDTPWKIEIFWRATQIKASDVLRVRLQ